MESSKARASHEIRGLPWADAGEAGYSIRFAEGGGALCAVCGRCETGAGPVGCLDDEPICDRCLLEGSHHLGLVLAVVLVARAYATTVGTPKERRAALAELGAFARIYEGLAAKSWPRRTFQIASDGAGGDDGAH